MTDNFSVQTDIRSRAPLAPPGSLSDQERERLAEAAKKAGISNTPQADALREMIFSEVLRRVAAVFDTDETVKALVGLSRRLDLAEIQAEEAARRLVGMRNRG